MELNSRGAQVEDMEMEALDMGLDASHGTTTQVEATSIQMLLGATLEATKEDITVDVNKEATKTVGVNATPGLETTTGTKVDMMDTTRSSNRSKEVYQWINTTLQESNSKQLRLG